MKSEFWTDGRGTHRISLTPENEIEKVMVEKMNLYHVEIEAWKEEVAPLLEQHLQLTFKEAGRKMPTYEAKR